MEVHLNSRPLTSVSGEVDNVSTALNASGGIEEYITSGSPTGQNLIFWPCLFPPACEGARAEEFIGQYVTPEGSDPANASRLGYTAEEVEKMEELTRLRYETDLREFNAAVEAAEAQGLPKPDGLAWLADKAARKTGGYFDDGNNERPTMI